MTWNGLLLIDKPSGCTSHDVVDRVRRILGQREVGHSGTLDPLASGLMVLLLGQATKLSEYILSRDKSYEVVIRLGVRTDQLDRMGIVLEEHPVNLSSEAIAQALNDLQGDLDLPVPVFSAVKVKGKKLYEMARKEQEVAPPKKTMKFYDLEILDIASPLVRAKISCSKGSYIRSWVNELGVRLKVGAIVDELRRLTSVPYNVHEAVSLEVLEEVLRTKEGAASRLGPAFIPMVSALPDWVTCSVKGREEQLLRHGQISHDLANRLIVAQKRAHLAGEPVGIKVVGAGGALVGLLEARPQQGLKIRRIFAS